MAVWNDEKIEAWARRNVEPYTPARVQPFSLDLTLGNEVRWPRSQMSRLWRRFDNWWHGRTFDKPKDLETDLRWYQPQLFAKLTIKRGQFVLLHSLEYLHMPEDVIGILVLSSSQARNGLEQGHAGLAEGLFHGQMVYEITCFHPQPITVWAGQRLGQMVFFESEAALIGYNLTGRYNGQTGAQVAL